MTAYADFRRALDIQPLGPIVSDLLPHTGVNFTRALTIRSQVATAVRTIAEMGLTNSEGLDVLCISVETAAVRFRYDGGNPAAAVGHRIASGGRFWLVGQANIANLRLIREGGTTAVVHLTFNGEPAEPYIASSQRAFMVGE